MTILPDELPTRHPEYGYPQIEHDPTAIFVKSPFRANLIGCNVFATVLDGKVLVGRLGTNHSGLITVGDSVPFPANFVESMREV